MKLKKRKETPAYRRGFLDGLYNDPENNKFKIEWNRHLYRAGYGAGIRMLEELQNPKEGEQP